MVKSVSWPTAEITGIGHLAIARATISSLKAHKSSIESAAPSDDDDIDVGHARNRRQTARDFDCRALALHARGPDDEMRGGITRPKDRDDVPQRGAVDRRDDPDLPRQGWQRTLP